MPTPTGGDHSLGLVGDLLPGEVVHVPAEELHRVATPVVMESDRFVAVALAVGLDGDPELGVRQVESGDRAVGATHLELVDGRRQTGIDQQIGTPSLDDLVRHALVAVVPLEQVT